MKINIIKESFGPFRVACVLDVDLKAKHESGVSWQEHLLTNGALYDLERKPSSNAEKLFWTEKNGKGELVRGKDFTRSKDIPATPEAAAKIKASLEDAGYQDVTLEVREKQEAGPAWKRNVAALVSMIGMDLETKESATDKVNAMANKLGLDHVEVSAYLKACLAKI